VLISLPSGAVGSGLILLVIVAAWLAVLVPMALRSHESADSLSSVDRFSDAMRVLARRDAAARARASAVAGRARLGSELDPSDLGDDLDDLDELAPDADLGWAEWEEDAGPSRPRQWLGTAATAVGRLRPDRGPRRPLTGAARRRRLLIALLALAVGTVPLGLLVHPGALVVHGVVDVLLVLFVVHLRRMARRRALSRHRSGSSPAPRQRPEPARGRPVRVAPVDVPPVEVEVEVDVEVEAGAEIDVAVVAQEPAEPVEPAVIPAARHDDPLPVASPGLGAPWSPVPVPPPIYASAPVAPRSPRTVDLTRPGAYSDAVSTGEPLPGMEPAPPRQDGAVEPRRAVNDW
jgi:hypothetical protein